MKREKKYLLFSFIPIYKSKKYDNGYKKYILGIPYASFQDNREFSVKRSFFQIFKKKKSYLYSKYYFLGIQIWCKKKSKINILLDKVSDLQQQTKNLKNNNNKLKTELLNKNNEIKTELQQNVQNLQNENANLKTELLNKNNEIKTELQQQMQDIKNNHNEVLNLIVPNYHNCFNDEQYIDNDYEELRYISPVQTTKCKICDSESRLLFESKIFHNKYEAQYFYCPHCGFLQVGDLKWLEESYKTPVTQEDTGVMYRNLELQKYISIILFHLLNPNGKYLDYGGGYGFLTRLLRDIGFEYYHYDKYCENITAQGFEGKTNQKYDAITSIETFEHFENPILEIEDMLKVSDTIIFSQEILPYPIPAPNEWWYYCLNHGQHISFYSPKTFKYLANKYNLYYSNIFHLHILSKENFETKVNYLKTQNLYLLFENVKQSMKPLFVDDMYHIIKTTNEQ